MPFRLSTDVSGEDLGVVFEQEQDDGTVHPIAYASRSLLQHEKYSVSKMEALGVVWGLKYFRAYVLGHPTVVYTDHATLKPLCILSIRQDVWLDGDLPFKKSLGRYDTVRARRIIRLTLCRERLEKD